MSEPVQTVLLAVGACLFTGAYLLGAIPFSYLVVRARDEVDVRERGSGNAGATNVLRVSGLGPGLLVLLLDMGKGAAAAGAARAFVPAGAPQGAGWVVGLTALAAVTGHVFPVYIGFRGGKGVAAAAGAFLVLAPAAALAGIAVFVAVTLLTRYVSLGSIAAVLSFPLLVTVLERPAPLWLQVCGAAVALLIVSRHRDNIQHIRAGCEMRLGDPLRRNTVAETTEKREETE